MYQTVKERLKAFIEYKKISVRSFEATCGFSYGYVGNMRNSMQPDKVMKVSQCFPEINTGWLLTGEGSMLRSDQSKIEIKLEDSQWGDDNTYISGCSDVELVTKLRQTEQEVERLKDKLDSTQALLASSNARIAELKDYNDFLKSQLYK